MGGILKTLMSWLTLAIIAYVLMAGIAISDKYFLVRRMPNPLAYGFSVGVLGLVFVFAIPFGFHLPPMDVLFAVLFSGALFTLALIILFWTLSRGAVSRVIPTIGALFPILTLLLSVWIVGERLNVQEYAAFAVLVVSGVLLSLSHEAGESNFLVVFLGAGVVAVLYALSSVLAKYAFTNHPFLSSFIWMRLAGGAMALGLLIVPHWRAQILGTIKKPESGKGLLVGIRVLAGAAFLMLHYAISLGSVTLINALKGIEYAVLFVTMLLISRFRPGIVQELFAWKLVAMKSVGIAGVIAGLWMIAG